jgi:leucyl-tRNA synthetase
MKLLIPFVPHLAHECLEQLNTKEINVWPKIDSALALNENIKIAIQINGKTKEIIEVKKDLDEKNAINESKKNKKIKDQLINNEIRRVIFVKDKIINFLIK